MSWKRVLGLYPYSPNKKSEQLYGGMAVINPIGLEVVCTAAARHAEVMVVDLRLEKQPLGELIREFKPDLVLCPDKDRDYHPDHTRTGQIVWDTHGRGARAARPIVVTP